MINHSIDDLSALKLEGAARLFKERKIYFPELGQLYFIELRIVEHLKHVDWDETSVYIYNILSLKTCLLYQTR